MDSNDSRMASGRRPTVHDVARLANASTAAVSRVLRNAYGVSDDMADRVRRAIDELGYRPHAAARGMRGKTYTVGIIHPDLRNTFFPDIFGAVAKPVMESERQLVFATSEWTSVDKVIDALHDRQVEGLILIAPDLYETRLLEAARQLPIVVTHRHSYSSQYDTVVSDDDLGARMVVQHLSELGHKRIVHLGPANGKIATQMRDVSARRARAYRRAMETFGLGNHTEVLDAKYLIKDGYRQGRTLFTRTQRPTAVFAGTDNVAFGVMQAAHEAGLSIPGDVSLVGYDNTQTGGLWPMSLTSVDQDPAEIGATAARLLLTRIAGRREAERHSFAPRLIVRNTTAPPNV
jgi:LacI family transcriptional regulator